MSVSLPLSGATRVSVPVMASNLLGNTMRPSWLATAVVAAAPRKRRRSRSGILVISMGGGVDSEQSPSGATLQALDDGIGRDPERSDAGRAPGARCDGGD